MIHRLRQIPIIGLFLMLGLMSIILLRVDWKRLENLAIGLDLPFVCAALAMFFLQLIFLACRWHILINVNRHYIKRARSARIFYAANVTNFVFLTSFSGMVVRFLLSIRAGSPWLNALCASITDRLFSFGILVGFSLITLPLTFHALGHIEISRAFTQILVVLCAITLAGLFYFLKNPKPLQNMFGVRRVRVGRAYLLRLFGSSCFPLATLYSLAAQCSFFLGVYFILCASHIAISFFSMMTILPTLAVLASLPLTIGGWGLREGVYVFGLGLLGVSIENAFLASIQVGFLTMFSSFLIALPVLVNRRFYVDLRAHSNAGHIVRTFLNR